MASVNVEKIIIAWLSANLDGGWNVYGDMPANRPEKFVLVDRTGGPRESMVMDKAEILIEVYCKRSRSDASDMAHHIGDIIPNLVALEPVTRSRVNSIPHLDDLIGKYHRYQVYVDVWARRDMEATDLEYPVVVDNCGDLTYVFNFTNQSTIVVEHNLGKYPSVSVVDSAGDDVECDVEYNDLNTLTLTSSVAFTGTVYCN